MPRGGHRILWNVLMTIAIVIMTGAAYFSVLNNWAALQGLLS
jgi:hypothetical protein